MQRNFQTLELINFFATECRLTYWLSNAVVLRAIISQVIGVPRQKLSAGSSIHRNGNGKGNGQSLSPLKWKESPPSNKRNKNASSLVDWNDPNTFMSALEKLEAWIFSRIIESVWWQVIPPYPLWLFFFGKCKITITFLLEQITVFHYYLI